MDEIWKNLQQVIQKGGNNEDKTFKKSMWKKGWLFEPKPGNNDRAFAPTNNTNQQETYKPSTQTQQWAKKVSAKKVSEEGWM